MIYIRVTAVKSALPKQPKQGRKPSEALLDIGLRKAAPPTCAPSPAQECGVGWLVCMSVVCGSLSVCVPVWACLCACVVASRVCVCKCV